MSKEMIILKQLKSELQDILDRTNNFVKDFSMGKTERQKGIEEGYKIVLDMINELETDDEINETFVDVYVIRKNLYLPDKEVEYLYTYDSEDGSSRILFGFSPCIDDAATWSSFEHAQFAIENMRELKQFQGELEIRHITKNIRIL